MPHDQNFYTHNDSTRCQYKQDRLHGRRPHRRQQSSGSMTSASREQSHQKTRKGTHLCDHLSHRSRYNYTQAHPHTTQHNTQRSPCQNRRQYSVYQDQPDPTSSVRYPTQLRSSGRSRTVAGGEYNHSLRLISRHRRQKSSEPRYDPAPPKRQTMDGMDSRLMTTQWNPKMFASGKRDRTGIVADDTDPTGHSFLSAPYYPEPMTSEQIKSFDAFRRAKSQSNPDFAVTNSSLDNLLGIDAMDMYTSTARTQAPYSISAQRSIYPNLIRTETDPNMRDPIDRLSEFQHNCLRSVANMIVCPHTVLPITVGLFTQSGSMRETAYLQLLGEQVSYLNASNQLRTRRAQFSLGSSLLPLVATLLIAYILGLTLGWQLGLAVAVTATLSYLIVCAIVLLGLRGKNCPKSVQFAETLSRYIRGCQLIMNILFYRAPVAPSSPKPVKLLPISMNLAGCVSGVEAAAQMTEKIWQFAEQKYGRLAVRFQWASKDDFAQSIQTPRKYCCLPLWLWLFVSVCSTLTMATLQVVRRQQWELRASVVNNQPDSTVSTDKTVSGSDANVVQEYYTHGIIVCAVLSGVSALALLAASASSIVRLIQGRPFQRRKENRPYGVSGKLGEPPADGCYGADPSRCDPASCMRFDARENGRFDEFRQAYPLHLTSAATVAATAAVAAVTAADRQWRLSGQEKARRGHRKLRKANGIKVVRRLFSPSKAVLQVTEDIESNSTGHSSGSRSSTFSGSDGQRGRSRSASDSDDMFTGHDNSFFHDAVLFESGELLIRDQYRGKRHNGKKTHLTQSGKQQSNQNDKTKSVQMQNLSKWKNLIRKGLMEACKVLSLIDSRMGDRQTRVVFCINATGGLPTSPAFLIKLATFVKLIDRLAMQPPFGGTSNEVPVLFSPYKTEFDKASTESKNLNPNATPTTWTQNIVVLLVASVPHVVTSVGTQSAMQNSFHSQFQRDGMKSCSLSNLSFPWTNFKLWWSVHHACHLPIYLEEEPIGHRLFEPAGSQAVPVAMPVPQQLPNFGSVFDLFVGSNELSDLNVKRLRQLLTQIAFMGRMISIERISTPDGGIFSHPAMLVALVTWLCLLQHWPFHTAWLAVFIEQHLKSRESTELPGPTGVTSPKHVTKGMSGPASAGPDGDSIDHLGWGNMLSQLHARILERLAPAVEIARMKALSVSMSASQPGPDFGTRHMGTYPPHVASTLEICDLAMRDRDPRRLTEFLHAINTDRSGMPEGFDLRSTFHSRQFGTFRAGAITVRQLLRVMRLTPLMNPQINQWIRDVLSTKLLTSDNSTIEQDVIRKASSGGLSLVKQTPTSPRVGRSLEDRTTHHTPTLSDSVCRVKLRHGLPSKKLSQMTVDDVCLLIRDISDLSVNHSNRRRTHKRLGKEKTHRGSVKPTGSASSDESGSPINDPAPPAPIGDRCKVPNSATPYEERIRHLNISGTVLSICPLSDLQKELNMSFGDWQLFSSVINYLKQKELSELSQKSTRPLHTCGLHPAEHLRRSDPRLVHAAGDHVAKWPPDPHLMSTVSDTSLALTVKSVPLTHQCGSPPQFRPISGVKNTKSMSALPLGSRAGMGPIYRHSALGQSQQHPMLCPQHSRVAKGMDVKEDSTAVLCPKHQEQVKSLLSGSQRELLKRSQTNLRSREEWNTAIPLAKLQDPGAARTKPLTSVYPTGFHTGPPLGVPSQTGRQLRQSQFQGERSRTLPNSFRENPASILTNPVHSQYCALHQNSQQRNWSTSPRPAWPSAGNPKDMMNAYTRGELQSGVPLQQTNMEPRSGGLVSTQMTAQRSLKSRPNSGERTPKETQVFDFSTPVRERLSTTDHMPSSSGQVARAEFCLPRDSESTSIAGELVEEVVEFSPAVLEQDSSISQDAETREEDKNESSDHSCNCNYWYSLEAAAAAAAATGTTSGGIANVPGSTKLKVDSRPANSRHGYAVFHADGEQSLSDSLSTTRSQLDASSGSSTDRSSSEASSNEQLDKLG